MSERLIIKCHEGEIDRLEKLVDRLRTENEELRGALHAGPIGLATIMEEHRIMREGLQYVKDKAPDLSMAINKVKDTLKKLEDKE